MKKRTIRKVKHPYAYRNITMTEGLHPQMARCGEVIKAYRAAKGLSRQQLSELVEHYSLDYGVRFTYQDIYGYEERLVSPKIEKLTALSRATGIDINYFTGYADAYPFRVPRTLVNKGLKLVS